MVPSRLHTQIKRNSLVDSVYETLLEASVSGTLAPGAELNSARLASQLDVSRTPVKEAIDTTFDSIKCLLKRAGTKRPKMEISRYRSLVRGYCRMTGREATLK